MEMYDFVRKRSKSYQKFQFQFQNHHFSDFFSKSNLYCSMSLRKIIPLNRKNNGFKVYKCPKTDKFNRLF